MGILIESEKKWERACCRMRGECADKLKPFAGEDGHWDVVRGFSLLRPGTSNQEWIAVGSPEGRSNERSLLLTWLLELGA